MSHGSASPSLLVITPTLGDSPWLRDAVASVQALGDCAHVLVAPLAQVRALATRFPEARVLAEDAVGLYAALNSARKTAAGARLVTWINDDDLLLAPGIERARRRLDQDSGVAAVYGRVNLIDAADREIGEVPVARRAEDLETLLAAGIMPLAQPGTVFRRELLDALGWFDGSYRLAGDLDLFVRALRTGARFVYEGARVASFRLHAGQLSKDETRARDEHARAVAGLGAAPTEKRAALRRFRWDNRWTYLRRVLRHGSRRMASLYRHV